MKAVDLKCRVCGASVVRQAEGFVCTECKEIAKPEVFISYHGGGGDLSRSSLPNALKLKEHLEKRGIPAFVCKAENRADFRSAISEALRACNHFVLVAKDLEMLLTSGWVFYELNTFDTYLKNSRNPSYSIKKPKRAVFTAFLYDGLSEADLVPHTDVFLGSDVITDEKNAFEELYYMLKRGIEDDYKDRFVWKSRSKARIQPSECAPVEDAVSPFIFKEVECGYSVSMSGLLASGYSPRVLLVPRSFRGEAVVEISDGGFAHCSGIKRLVLPDTVRKIGNCAFAGCLDLETVEICGRVETIESGAFMDCRALKRLTLPEGLVTLGDFCFSGCTNLFEISLPSSLCFVGKGVFQNCVYLRHNEIDGARYLGNVKHPHLLLVRAGADSDFRVRRFCRVIGEKAFLASEIRSVFIPRSVVSISECAFKDAKQLQSVKTEGSSLLYVGASAFYRCVRLSSVSLPDSVEYIGERAFMHCVSLPEFNLPQSLSSLSGCVFYGCVSLKQLTINEKLRSIEESALHGTCIQQVELNESVEHIGDNAFLGCEKLTSVVLPKSLSHIGDSFIFESEDVKLCYKDDIEKPNNLLLDDMESKP